MLYCASCVVLVWPGHGISRAECDDLPTVSACASHSTHNLSTWLLRWLGQNSKQNKLSRQLTDVQARMRLKVLGDKVEIRQSYVPALFAHIVKPLVDEGAVSVVIVSSMFRLLTIFLAEYG